MNLLKGKKGRAAAIAAVLLILGIIALVLYRQPIFLGVFSDDSGLAMVREGNTKEIKKEGSRKNTLNIAVTDAVGVTNPAYASSEADQMISSLIFEGFMEQNGQGVYEKELAKSFTMAEDGMSCQIELKPDMKFSDGSTVTAEDAAFSIAAMCQATDGDSAGVYQNIEGVTEFLERTTDMPSGIVTESDTKLTVRFATPSPDNMALALCKVQKKPENLEGGMAIVVPQLSMSGIGTGAYVKAEGRDGGSIRLEANPHYRKKMHDITSVDFVTYGTYNVADAIEAGDVDIAFFAGNSGFFEPFYDGKQFHIYEKTLDSVQYLAINHDNWLLRQPSAREAVAAAIDKDALVNGSLSRYFTKAEALAWESGAFAGNDPVSFDTENAKKLLEEAKEAAGGEVSLTLRLPILDGNEIQEEIAKAVKKDLEKAGFTIEVEKLSQADYLQQVYMLGNYDLLLLSSGGWESPSSYEKLVNDTQGLSVSSMSENVQEAVGRLAISYDQKSLEKALKEVNTVLNQENPVIPLVRQKKFVAVSADLKKYQMTSYDTFINNVWEIRVK